MVSGNVSGAARNEIGNQRAIQDAEERLRLGSRRIAKRIRLLTRCAGLVGFFGIISLLYFSLLWLLERLPLDDYDKLGGLWSGLLAFASFLFVYLSFLGQEKQNLRVEFDIAKAQAEVEGVRRQQSVSRLTAFTDMYWRVAEAVRWRGGEEQRFSNSFRSLRGRDLVGALMKVEAATLERDAIYTLGSYWAYLKALELESLAGEHWERDYVCRIMRAQMLPEEYDSWVGGGQRGASDNDALYQRALVRK